MAQARGNRKPRPSSNRRAGGRPAGEKTRNSGQWTEARFNSFIKSLLRSGTVRWGPIQECLKAATTRRGFKMCAGCGQEVPVTYKDDKGKRKKNAVVDHIEPIISVEEGFTTWDDCIQRMFCELEGLQVLCHKCHSEKSAAEAASRKVSRKFATQYGRTYNSWKSMLARCREGHHAQETYFDRGIDVCDKWKESFFYFLEDMGERPEGLTLDRIDNDLGYFKENCQWSDPKEQARNKTNTHYLKLGEECKPLVVWSEETGIPVSTILNRLGRGDSVEDALDKDRVRKTRKSSVPIKQVYEDYLSGMSYAELGLKYGYHPDTLRKKIYKEREKNEQQ